jgi:hypothetical protein
MRVCEPHNGRIDARPALLHAGALPKATLLPGPLPAARLSLVAKVCFSGRLYWPAGRLTTRLITA